MWILVTLQCVIGASGYACKANITPAWLDTRANCLTARSTLYAALWGAPTPDGTARTFATVLCIDVASERG